MSEKHVEGKKKPSIFVLYFYLKPTMYCRVSIIATTGKKINKLE